MRRVIQKMWLRWRGMIAALVGTWLVMHGVRMWSLAAFYVVCGLVALLLSWAWSGERERDK